MAPFCNLLIERASYIFCWLCCEFGCQYQCNRLPEKTRFKSDLLNVEWDVKLCSLHTGHWMLHYTSSLQPVITSDVVLGLGPWLSLRTEMQSLVLSLALKVKSLVVSLFVIPVSL